jgi:hypothetical protein
MALDEPGRSRRAQAAAPPGGRGERARGVSLPPSSSPWRHSRIGMSVLPDRGQPAGIRSPRTQPTLNFGFNGTGDFQ